jgi:threonine/homoserine/homoserine lactone efflux protein
MSDATTLVAFFITSLAIELTPGPNMAYLALVGVSRGRRDGFMAVLGVALGLALLGALVGIGLGSLILENRVVYEVLRWAGAAYLVWLAWDGWREARQEAHVSALPYRAFAYFGRGFLTNLLNPKAALFFVTVMPGFIAAAEPPLGQATLFVALYVAAATLIHIAIVLLAATLQPLFARPRLRRAAAFIFSAALVAVAIWLLLKAA